jgi:opacity protein-like surface antigen
MKFKRSIFLFSTICLLLSINSVKSQSFEEGQNALSFGYGVGTFFGGIFSTYADQTDYKYTNTGPLYVKYESAVTDRLGLGINLAYAQYKLSYTYENFGSGNTYLETDTYTTYSILARLNFHFGDVDHFDPYWGFGVGFRDGKFKYESTDPDGTNDLDISFNFPFGFETTIGSRYLFTDNFGIYLETGIAKSVLQFGLTAKF